MPGQLWALQPQELPVQQVLQGRQVLPVQRVLQGRLVLPEPPGLQKLQERLQGPGQAPHT